MKYILRLLAVAGLLYLAAPAQSQTVTPGTEIFEMLAIAETYREMANLSFNVAIKYTDSLNTDSIVEQMTANYKLRGGLYYTYIDSTEIVQGNRYSLVINHYDSTITVGNRQDYPNMLNVPVGDTLYYRSFMQSITVTTVNDSTRSLKIRFKPGAQYTSYEIQYSYPGYRIKDVKCYMLASLPGTDPDLFPSGKSLISFTFSNYSTAAISETWFSEDKFITVAGGAFQTRPAYNGYLIDTNILLQ